MVVATCIAASLHPVAAQDVRPASTPFRFGSFRVQIDGLSHPAAVAIGPDYRIFIAESGADRVAVYDDRGALISHIGERGGGPGQFIHPSGIDIGPDGRVFVADTGNHRVQVFGPTFEHELTIGRRGSAAGQFNQPRGIAVAGSDILIADSGNDRVQVFGRDGKLRSTFGETGRGTWQFNNPADVAAFGDDYIAVSDSANNRIQLFDHAGTWIRAWGDWGPFPGLFDIPAGLVGSGDQLLAVDRRNHRIQSFNQGGKQQWAWGVHAIELREGEGRLHYPDDVAIAPDGSFAVVCEAFEDRVQVFNRATGNEPPQRPTTTKQTHFGMHLDAASGFMIVAEPEGHFIYVIDTTTRTPTIVSQFGRRGWNHGQFIRISGIAWDANANEAYIADEARGVVMWLRVKPLEGELRFDPFRVILVQEFDLATLVGDGPPPRPGAIARSDDGELFVVDERSGHVLRFDEQMNLIGRIGDGAAGEPPLRRPTDLAITPDDKQLVVVDAGDRSVQMFELGGAWVRRIDAMDPNDELWQPFGVAVAFDNSVLVSDTRGRVVRFDAANQVAGMYGVRGEDHEQFWNPAGLAVNESGTVTVVDYGNHRCQQFTLDGQWLMTFGSASATTPGDRLGDD